MLQKHGSFNDLSPEFREKMETKVKSLGKKVKFKFKIAKDNPDPEKYNGKIIYPNMYTLDPRTFRINDPLEKRSGVSKAKEIGLVDKVDREGIPESFHRIRVNYRNQGELVFEPEESYDDFEFVLYLLLHPKLENGEFQDKNKTSMFVLIDEQAEAKKRREKRAAVKKAVDIARSFDDEKVKEFAAAMQWDGDDVDILRDMVEDLAESDPGMFDDLTKGKSIEYQATIKRALDKGIILFDPAEYTFIYESNKQLITRLSAIGDKNHIEKFSEWCQTGGQKAEEAYKRIKGLVSK